MATSTLSDNPADVEARMAAVRARLQQESIACRQARERWTDWRVHVKAHPWAAAGIAAAVGYFIVPGPRHKSSAAPIASAPALVAQQPSLASRMFSGLGQRVAQQVLSFGASWALAQLTASMNQAPSRNGADAGTPHYSEGYTS